MTPTPTAQYLAIREAKRKRDEGALLAHLSRFPHGSPVSLPEAATAMGWSSSKAKWVARNLKDTGRFPWVKYNAGPSGRTTKAIGQIETFHAHIAKHFAPGDVVRPKAELKTLGISPHRSRVLVAALKADERFPWRISNGRPPAAETPSAAVERARKAAKAKRLEEASRVPPCIACNDPGGHMVPCGIKPIRYDGRPFGFPGDICHDCYHAAKASAKVPTERIVIETWEMDFYGSTPMVEGLDKEDPQPEGKLIWRPSVIQAGKRGRLEERVA